jgi:hypothetical protein
VTALFARKRPFGGPLEVVDLALDHAGFPLQTSAFFGKSLLNHVFDGRADLDESPERSRFRLDRLSAHSFNNSRFEAIFPV